MRLTSGSIAKTVPELGMELSRRHGFLNLLRHGDRSSTQASSNGSALMTAPHKDEPVGWLPGFCRKGWNRNGLSLREIRPKDHVHAPRSKESRRCRHFGLRSANVPTRRIYQFLVGHAQSGPQ